MFNRWFWAAWLLVGCAASCFADEREFERRLFDFSPISTSNPVVARLGGTIEIPLSEWRAYVLAERPHAISSDADLEQKRAILEDLITEYLLVDEAYRAGAASTPAFMRRMETTRTLLLADFMTERVIDRQKNSPSENARTTEALANRLFDAAPIDISNEAYAALRQAAGALVNVEMRGRRGPIPESPLLLREHQRQIVEHTPNLVLARYPRAQQLAVRDVLVIYAGLGSTRPDITTPAGLLELLKPVIVPELLALEAQRLGVPSEPAFSHKLIQNRNALLRFQAQGAIEAEATRQQHASDAAGQLEAWFAGHRNRFARPAPAGIRLPQLEEVRTEAEGEWSVSLYENLRAAKAEASRAHVAVEINEAALRVAPVRNDVEVAARN